MLPLVLTIFPVALAETSHPTFFIYIGTYTESDSKGIYAYRFDPLTGETTPIGLVAESQNPSFLAVHPSARFLYAVNEVDHFESQKSGSVSAFSIDQSAGKLTLLNRVSSLGTGPAHLSLDRRGKYLLVANYGGGSVAVFPIANDGRIGKASSFVQHSGSSVNHDRQAAPHPHQILATKDNRFVLVPDLGTDEVVIYRFDSAEGALTQSRSEFVKTQPGAGPRHLALHPNGRFAYLANEMQSTVLVFSYDANAGSLIDIQTVTTLPKDFTGQNSAAEILTDASGAFLYVSNRGHDSIAVFAINRNNGTLTPIQDLPSGGRTPRNIAIDPTGKWLFAANQDSHNIAIFRVDSRTGRLTPTTNVLHISAPACVTFAPDVR